MHLVAQSEQGLTPEAIEHAVSAYFVAWEGARKVLILPPDISRGSSYAGAITKTLWDLFSTSEVEIMPTLGTHVPMTREEIKKMYSGLPPEKFLVHDWRNDTVNLGQVSPDYIESISEGISRRAVGVDVNKRLVDPSYDLLVSVGQVVPHEVAGFANYTKNIVVGCGGSGMINESHYLGALYGMERIMGRASNPVRRLYNYAVREHLSHAPIVYVLTVTTVGREGLKVEGLFIGTGDDLFLEAATLSAAKNMTFLEQPLRKAVVYLDPDKFRTTWVGNKSIYRTRMAIADGGELIVIAPGLESCGEDKENDRLIKKFGYRPQKEVLELIAKNEDLSANLSVAAHLIHGSSEGRFKITYAPGKMSRDLIHSLKYDYAPIEQTMGRYNPASLREGMNLVGGEEIFFISNPAVGLWATKARFYA